MARGHQISWSRVEDDYSEVAAPAKRCRFFSSRDLMPPPPPSQAAEWLLSIATRDEDEDGDEDEDDEDEEEDEYEDEDDEDEEEEEDEDEDDEDEDGDEDEDDEDEDEDEEEEEEEKEEEEMVRLTQHKSIFSVEHTWLLWSSKQSHGVGGAHHVTPATVAEAASSRQYRNPSEHRFKSKQPATSVPHPS
nr:unnamed protein product [Spirometra erinaceieuropaei]